MCCGGAGRSRQLSSTLPARSPRRAALFPRVEVGLPPKPGRAVGRVAGLPAPLCENSGRALRAGRSLAARSPKAGRSLRAGRSPKAGLSPNDRKSVVAGKRVAVRVDLGGRRLLKKKKDKIMINK